MGRESLVSQMAATTKVPLVKECSMAKGNSISSSLVKHIKETLNRVRSQEKAKRSGKMAVSTRATF